MKCKHGPSSWYSKPHAHVPICSVGRIPYAPVRKRVYREYVKSKVKDEGRINTPVHSLQVDFSVLTSCLSVQSRNNTVWTVAPWCSMCVHVRVSLADSIALPVLLSQVHNSMNTTSISTWGLKMRVVWCSPTVQQPSVFRHETGFKVSLAIQLAVQYPLFTPQTLGILTKSGKCSRLWICSKCLFYDPTEKSLSRISWLRVRALFLIWSLQKLEASTHLIHLFIFWCGCVPSIYEYDKMHS